MSKEMGAGGRFDIFLDSACGQLFQLCPAERPVVRRYVLVCKAV